MSHRRVAVLMGGWGEEREISLRSGEAVARALVRQGHSVHRVLAGPGLAEALRALPVDVAFLALHGRTGEDGGVQGFLEVMGLPYTGSGVLASALAMDKPTAKKLLRLHNIPTPTGYRLGREEFARAAQLHGDLGFPAVVKPAASGSSCGLSWVGAAEDLGPAVEAAGRFGGAVLVERFVEGREVSVGVVGGRVLGSCEVVPPGEVLDHAGKLRGGSRCHLPPRLSPTRLANAEAVALSAWRALGCRGYGRVDLIASDTANDFVLEVNTLPGLAPTSLLPRIARAAGMAFEALVETILAEARLDQVPAPSLAVVPDEGAAPAA